MRTVAGKMKTANIVIWLHGVQSETFDPQPIYGCQAAVQGLINGSDAWVHSIFNWDQEVTVRERILWDRVKSRGNFLVRSIRRGIVFTGCDMWFTLGTMKDGKPAWLSADILNKLSSLLKEKTSPFNKEEYAVKYHLVCHSWGTWVGMRHIIDHPETDFNFVTFGCPLFYGSAMYPDWGSPKLIPNLKRWTNIAYPNDPIATVAADNPNPEWQAFVKDHVLSRWQQLPIRSHIGYWSDKEVQAIIAESLKSFVA